MNTEQFIRINDRTYSAEDIAAGKHHDDPAITEPGDLVNGRGEVVGIQAGAIYGDITFD